MKDHWDGMAENWLLWWFGTESEAVDTWECFYWFSFESTAESFRAVMGQDAHRRLLRGHRP